MSDGGSERRERIAIGALAAVAAFRAGEEALSWRDIADDALELADALIAALDEGA